MPRFSVSLAAPLSNVTPAALLASTTLIVAPCPPLPSPTPNVLPERAATFAGLHHFFTLTLCHPPPGPRPQVLLEPLTESLPQSVLQSAVYLIGQRAGDTVSTTTYLASAITSALALTKEAAVLAWIVFEAGSWPTVGEGEAGERA